ncbi:hypothetical protein Ancab_038556 [Ancistrocladus abbreviatus]
MTKYSRLFPLCIKSDAQEVVRELAKLLPSNNGLGMIIAYEQMEALAMGVESYSYVPRDGCIAKFALRKIWVGSFPLKVDFTCARHENAKLTTFSPDIINKSFPIKVNDHSFIIMVVEEFTCRQCNLVETSRHREKGPVGFSNGVWSKTYSRVLKTSNGGDATPNDSNSGDFEVCNNEPKLPILEGSRGISKASKSFKECSGISQGDLNMDGALNEEGMRKESTRQKRSDIRSCLLTPDAIMRKETEVLAGGKIDNGPLLGPKSLEGPDSVSKALGDGDSTSLQSYGLNIVLKMLKKRKKIRPQSSFVVGPGKIN